MKHFGLLKSSSNLVTNIVARKYYDRIRLKHKIRNILKFKDTLPRYPVSALIPQAQLVGFEIGEKAEIDLKS